MGCSISHAVLPNKQPDNSKDPKACLITPTPDDRCARASIRPASVGANSLRDVKSPAADSRHRPASSAVNTDSCIAADRKTDALRRKQENIRIITTKTREVARDVYHISPKLLITSKVRKTSIEFKQSVSPRQSHNFIIKKKDSVYDACIVEGKQSSVSLQDSFAMHNDSMRRDPLAIVDDCGHDRQRLSVNDEVHMNRQVSCGVDVSYDDQPDGNINKTANFILDNQPLELYSVQTRSQIYSRQMSIRLRQTSNLDGVDSQELPGSNAILQPILITFADLPPILAHSNVRTSPQAGSETSNNPADKDKVAKHICKYHINTDSKISHNLENNSKYSLQKAFQFKNKKEHIIISPASELFYKSKDSLHHKSVNIFKRSLEEVSRPSPTISTSLLGPAYLSIRDESSRNESMGRVSQADGHRLLDCTPTADIRNTTPASLQAHAIVLSSPDAVRRRRLISKKLDILTAAKNTSANK